MRDQARGLRVYLQQKRDAMRAAAARKPAGDDWRETVQATCVADDATGVRKMTTEGWAFIGDSGPDFGGWQLGPSSPSLLCGMLSTCLTHTYLIAAAWFDIPLDRVEVTVSAQNNDAHLLDIASDDPDMPFDITVRVKLDAPDATEYEIETLHGFTEQRCPLTNLIRSRNEVTFVVE